ncbi:hypothetical protein [Catenulispora rubra]|uniref:hypothetical protein n=1 Tax=Catenulispora rubra TaxID=280293 RepID=UPI0018925E52|nr:hypothetical protein [Catenulispora rubra]
MAHSQNSLGKSMKPLLSSTRVLWFLFLGSLVVAVIAAAGVAGDQGLMSAVGMTVVSFSAGAALLRRSFDRAVRRHLHPFDTTGGDLAPVRERLRKTVVEVDDQ